MSVACKPRGQSHRFGWENECLSSSVRNLRLPISTVTQRTVSSACQAAGEERAPHSAQSRRWFHPHLHCVVPGGGVSLDGSRWVDAAIEAIAARLYWAASAPPPGIPLLLFRHRRTFGNGFWKDIGAIGRILCHDPATCSAIRPGARLAHASHCENASRWGSRAQARSYNFWGNRK